MEAVDIVGWPGPLPARAVSHCFDTAGPVLPPGELIRAERESLGDQDSGLSHGFTLCLSLSVGSLLCFLGSVFPPSIKLNINTIPSTCL